MSSKCKGNVKTLFFLLKFFPFGGEARGCSEISVSGVTSISRDFRLV